MSVANIVNGMNQFTQSAAAVQGAADAMVPAIYAVDGAINQVTSVFTGDTYQPQQPYPQPYPVSQTPIKVGLVGSLLTGAVAGGVTHQQTANALRSFKTDGFGAGMKNLGMAGLKAGAIGAGVSGVLSGLKNFTAASRGEISKARAGGNVVADTVGGLLAGSGGGLSAGVASMALGSFGLSGIGLTIGAAVAGAAGAAGTNFFYNNSGVRDSIADTMSKSFGDPQGNAYGYHQNYANGY